MDLRKTLKGRLRNFTTIGITSLLLASSCGPHPHPMDPDLPPRATTQSISPISGMAPLRVTARYECSDDKGIREYKIIKGERETSNGKNPINTTLIYTQPDSLKLGCTDTGNQTTWFSRYIRVTQPPVNNPPQTEITPQFGNDGKITYTFSGTDSDGSIDYISVRINGGIPQNLDNGSFELEDIIEGTNSVTATAYDNEGLADPTPAEYSFVSPTESQAEEIILGYLTENSPSYEKFEREVLLSLGAAESFYVDFLLTKRDSTDAVVNYVGHEEDLTEESANQGLLNIFGIPNLYLVRMPETEIKSRLDIFKNNGFN